MVRTLDPARWQAVIGQARRWTADDTLPAITLLTGDRERVVGPVSLGRQRLNEAAPVVDQPIYLVASITKPLVAMRALQLVEAGQLSLSDRVVDFLPEFGQQGKYATEVRHLLTHTSGLPDMLPENRQLRARHAPLAAFVEGAIAVGLAFPPGRGLQYQSMGFAILGAILEHFDGRPLREQLHVNIFEPLGMTDTALGAPSTWFEPGGAAQRIPEIRLPDDQVGTDWGWNSRYWRELGAPWGGLLTTAPDLAKVAQALLRNGRSETSQVVFSPAAIEQATRNQLDGFREVPEADRRCRPWGWGWRLLWPTHSANFGDLCGQRTFGHWGSTGTVMWIDPDAEVFAVLLSTQPQDPHGRFLARLSNQIAGAWV